MKKYFITGMVILLPLALTMAIVIFIINFLTEPFVGLVKAILQRYDLLDTGFLFLSAPQVQKYFSQLVILGLLFFFTVGLGFLTQWFFIHYFIRFWEHILHKIPFISSVYRTSQDVIQTIFTSSTNSFKQVVLVPFPSAETLAVGLITKDNLPSMDDSGNSLIAVFVPTTPNPTSGFLMMYKEEHLTYIDMKIEDAFKYVISCGVISSPFQPISKTEALVKMAKQKAESPTP